MENNKNISHYETLLNMQGISGHENKVSKYLENEYKKYPNEIIKDKLGSIFTIKKGSKNDLKIMIAGHMDEVGAMVSNISKDGFIKFIAIGGVNAEVFLSQHVEISNNSGAAIRGVVAAIPPHISKDQKNFCLEDMFVDIGVSSKEEVIAMGINIGSPINFINDFYFTNDKKRIVSKAWDNRFGCAMTLEILEALQEVKHESTLIIGATVQEELGLRGARVATQMITPDVFIALDASPTSDFLNAKDGFGKLGEGFLIRMYDPGYIMSRGVKEYISELAIKNNIKFQEFFSKGLTDAAAAQYNSSIAFTIGLPCRYIHSTVSMADIADLEAVKQIVIAIIKDLNREKFEEIKNK